MWVKALAFRDSDSYEVWRDTLTGEELPVRVATGSYDNDGYQLFTDLSPEAVEAARAAYAAARPATFALPFNWDWRALRSEIGEAGGQATFRGAPMWLRFPRQHELNDLHFIGGPTYVSTVRHDGQWEPAKAIDWSLDEKTTFTKVGGVLFTIGASIMLAAAAAAAVSALSAGAGAAAGTAGGTAGTATVSGAELAALVESGAVGTAGATLEAAALAGQAVSFSTATGALGVAVVEGAELAALVESGAVGEAGAQLEAAALSGESIIYSTQTGAILNAPGLPQLEVPSPRSPPEPAPSPPQTLPLEVTKIVEALKSSAVGRLLASLAPQPEVTARAAERRSESPGGTTGGGDGPLPALFIAGVVLAFFLS